MCYQCQNLIIQHYKTLPITYLPQYNVHNPHTSQNLQNLTKQQELDIRLSSWLLEYKKKPDLVFTRALVELLYLFWYQTYLKNIKEQEKTSTLYIWIPIPIHQTKLHQTGFDHVYEILKLFHKQIKQKVGSKAFNRSININTLILKLLVKNRLSTQHETLNLQQRKLAIQGLYAMANGWEHMINQVFQSINKINKNITTIKWIIFDDIATTGMTTQECLNVLKTNLENHQKNHVNHQKLHYGFEIITLGQTVKKLTRN